jgi:hypothetical protein
MKLAALNRRPGNVFCAARVTFIMKIFTSYEKTRFVIVGGSRVDKQW